MPCRKMFIILISCMLGLVPASYARENRFSDEAELSYVDTGGNTSITNLSARNTMSFAFSENLVEIWKIGALYGKSSADTYEESYYTELRTDYLLGERLFATLITGWSRDEFVGIESRYYVGPALGYRFLDGPAQYLSAEIGMNYATEDYIEGDSNRFMEGRAYGLYRYSITERSRFTQSVEVLYDFEQGTDYNIIGETALINYLNDALSFKAGYVVKYDNKPVPDTLKKTDTRLSLAIVVGYRAW